MISSNRKGSGLISAALWLAAVVSLPALEPWADDKLPVKDGLELWLDASRENTCRTAAPASGRGQELPRIPNGAPLDIWHDASGNKRDVRQSVPAARPHLVQSPQGSAVRFDGKDDFLLGSGADKVLTNFTIFIQASARTNQGGMRAFLAASRYGRNDYSTGLNVDLGPDRSDKLTVVNIEGAGFTGIRNLLKAQFPFEQPRVFSIGSSSQTRRVKLFADGVLQDERERLEAEIGFDLWTVGARFYSNTAEPAHVQGFLDGDISQVLVYNRFLDDAERAEVERFLAARSFSLATPGRKPAALETITKAGLVRMFRPGFEGKEFPLHLNDINSVKYRDDGKLVALGYDGNIWLLSDTDGDGLEDHAAPFWTNGTLRAPIGLALTPPDYPRGRGVFVPSKGKLSLIVDTNNDDKADQEIVIAKGWTELPHGVDTLGAAMDKDGSIYFGLGTANFTDAYLVDPKTHQAAYSLQSERGTILKVSSDFSRREIFCTGIRFSVGLAFNVAGDLFCTDQEGATWLPNGNPFDELLFVERGRHYGFPPRHPKYLQNVIDEPSVFDYGPQHQSTCGLNFNEPVNGGPVFGPAAWQGDALITGYSRGKLYRTKLVKTKAGYVAQNQVIGSVNGLPSDACVSPRGELVVSVHSGQPDWGSGPTGPGKLYKILYSNKDAPQPVAIWPSGPTETLVEFDRPVDAVQLKDWKSRITVTEGRYVGAGDRFEVFRPGYQNVINQLAEPRFALEVQSTALGSDGQTLVIRTVPRTSAVNYAIALPSLDPLSRQTPDAHLADTIELACDLSGVEAVWEPTAPVAAALQAFGAASTWLPHLDLSVARELTKTSPTHSAFWTRLSQPGKLTLRTQLDLWQMLHPATQPGSKLDFEYPAETVTAVFRSDLAITLVAPSSKLDRISQNEIHLTVTRPTNSWVPVEVALHTGPAAPDLSRQRLGVRPPKPFGAGALDREPLSTSEQGTPKSKAPEDWRTPKPGGETPALDVSWFTAEDPRPRALPLRRILLPRAKPAEAAPRAETERTIPELAGGNWLNGQRVFFGEQAICSKCHFIRGQGAHVGPDLSNLVYRDYASVLKDIVEPSAAINPDHVANTIELKDGSESLSGVPAGGDDSKLLLADASGRITPVARSNIRSMQPSTKSLMPEGLLQGLSEQQRKDLLTFLLLPEPLQPAPLEIAGAPPPRKHAEVETALGKTAKLVGEPAAPFQILLCAGPKDHGPGEHDYPLWQKRWSKLLALAEGVSVDTAFDWPTPEQLRRANVVIFYSNNPGWSAARGSELDAVINRGGGLVYIHYAVDGHDHCDELAQRIGLAWRGGASAFRHGPLDLKFASSSQWS